MMSMMQHTHILQASDDMGPIAHALKATLLARLAVTAVVQPADITIAIHHDFFDRYYHQY